MTSSFAAWTKNEGLLFVAVVGLVLLVGGADRMSRRRAIAAWTAGALPVLIIVAWFKLSIAPTSDLAQPLSAFWEKLIDPSRHLLVVRTSVGAAGPWWVAAGAIWLISTVAATVAGSGLAAIRISSVVLLMLAGYHIVYVITPHSLEWHVNTSFSRLVAQLWPSAVLALMLACGRSAGLANAGSDPPRLALLKQYGGV